MNNQLVILSDNKEGRTFIINMLSKLFGNQIEFLECSSSDYDVEKAPPLVLSTESTINIAPNLFPTSRIMLVNHLISNENIDKLIILPKGTKVLVANDPRSAAIETIGQLQDMGLNHLDYEPYWIGKKNYNTNIDIVIYPGLKKYCPPGHSQYIDIGYREISLSIIAAIIQEYGLPLTMLDRIQRTTSLRYINAAYEINSYLVRSEIAAKNFERIIHMSENVLIATDYKDTIIHFNHAAEQFWHAESSTFTKKNFHTAFSNQRSLIRLYTSVSPVENQVATINGTRALITISQATEDSTINKLISIVPAEAIHNSDARIRTQLKESGFKAKYTFADILGESPAIQEAIFLAQQYAKSNASVFIAGESGTGKELFAQSIHNLSNRNNFPFVSVNCAALPESLAESELFGYDEGSFTGASKGGKSGKFEMAHRGTIFLDEIGDAPLSLQTKLLRVIEEQEIVRIGSNKVMPIDVRIICASNRNLKEMVNEGLFRQDLYYRINVLPLDIPPLRMRKEDIPPIACAFFQQMGMQNNILMEYFIKQLCKFEWPGNIRELRSAVHLLTTLSGIAPNPGNNTIDETYWKNIMQNHFGSTTNEVSTITPAPSAINLKFLTLQVIKTKSEEGLAFGRGSLLKDTTLSKAGLTEYRLKKFIAQFVEEDLITIGSTKQGMRITQKGVEIIAKIHSGPNGFQ